MDDQEYLQSQLNMVQKVKEDWKQNDKGQYYKRNGTAFCCIGRSAKGKIWLLHNGTFKRRKLTTITDAKEYGDYLLTKTTTKRL